MSTVTITAADVNKLRMQTGAGMMDCKKALTEANGDFEAAVDLLRKKGAKVAANRADRAASEGCVLAKVSADGTFGVVLSLNCETDFVAKNEGFVTLTTGFIDLALSNKVKTKEEFLKQNYQGLSVSEKLVEQTGVIGEKLEIGSYEIIESPAVAAYIHPGNRLATLVGLTKGGDANLEAGRQVAMQVAAMNPVALDEKSVTQDIIDREIAVGKEQAIAEGKPADMAEKIAVGKLNKFYKESTLLNQEFIRDSKKTVKQFLSDTDKELTATGFKRVALG
ncbi:MAG TPA: translation elongation factor Ts [Flavobacteriales bacterium]|nr:translation elongation factor Ts [Flavobacteriales bacterium]